MSTLFVLAFVIAHFYYKYENESVDPRIVEANLLYDKYNEMAQEADYNSVFSLLDSIQSIYSKIPHYKNSYEVGVLYNNRAAAYITMAINPELSDALAADSLLELAMYNADKSIKIYKQWLAKWKNKTEEQIKNELVRYFPQEDKAFKGRNVSRFINRRSRDIVESQYETERRLSVSHTNRGIIFRHQSDYEAAVQEYLKALELWPDNLAAENNLNIIFDKPLKRRSILRRLFPKPRRVSE